MATKNKSTKKATRKTAETTAKTPAPKPTKSPAKAEANTKAKKPRKLSAIDAALKILAEVKKPMNCKALVEAMVAKKLWSSPNGKTPAATLYSAILRDIQTGGKNARFTKVERGMFTLGKGA